MESPFHSECLILVVALPTGTAFHGWGWLKSPGQACFILLGGCGVMHHQSFSYGVSDSCAHLFTLNMCFCPSLSTSLTPLLLLTVLIRVFMVSGKSGSGSAHLDCALSHVWGWIINVHIKDIFTLDSHAFLCGSLVFPQASLG